jgi:hypothetical protein
MAFIAHEYVVINPLLYLRDFKGGAVDLLLMEACMVLPPLLVSVGYEG